MEVFVYQFQAFLMILARLLGLFQVAPVFSSDSIPFAPKILLSFMISLILFPVTAAYLPKVPGSMGVYALYVFSEILTGVLIGYTILVIFSAIQMAGEFFNVQIGFAYTEVLDPMTQVSLPVLSTLKNLLGILIFLYTGMHRFMIEALAISFQKIQFITMDLSLHKGILRSLESAIGAMFLVSFKIAFPVVGILLLVTITESLMGKAAPQLNITQLSFPIKVVIGIFTLISIMTFIVAQIQAGFELSLDKVFTLMKDWPKQ